LIYHSGTYFGLYIIITKNKAYLALALLIVSILTLRSFDTEAKIVIVAFLWYPFPIHRLLLQLLLSMLLINLHKIMLLMMLHEDFRIRTVLHGLIHIKELLHLMLITLLYLLLLLCRVVEVWRPLAYD
jgi:hypothetical protein